jgi:hypothetical protein
MSVTEQYETELLINSLLAENRTVRPGPAAAPAAVMHGGRLAVPQPLVPTPVAVAAAAAAPRAAAAGRARPVTPAGGRDLPLLIGDDDPGDDEILATLAASLDVTAAPAPPNRPVAVPVVPPVSVAAGALPTERPVIVVNSRILAVPLVAQLRGAGIGVAVTRMPYADLVLSARSAVVRCSPAELATAGTDPSRLFETVRADLSPLCCDAVTDV